ncbi:hypothetical protein JTE90_007593 [Oedothorax gibbosus]|uniref:Chromo domain-containing protein n=1 Tax=Oedothorax gibbosus TaxID=931172 RepID=A0AAV6TNT0_9ARAC|nr:hypothetical protein JTE90_007593 [Oedothorax gibbosus]
MAIVAILWRLGTSHKITDCVWELPSYDNGDVISIADAVNAHGVNFAKKFINNKAPKKRGKSPRSLLHQGTLLGNPEEATLELELNDCTIALCTLSTVMSISAREGKLKTLPPRSNPSSSR